MTRLPCFGCGLPQLLKCFFWFSDKAKIGWLSEKLILVIMKQSISASDAVSQQEALRWRFVVFFTESGVFETETSFLWSVAVNPSRLCHLSQTEAKQETRFCVCVMQTSKRYSAGRRTEVRVWLQSLWDRVSKRPRLKDGISLRLPPNPPREFDQQFPENCWSNAKRLFVNTLKHDSSGSDLRQIIRNVWECLTEAEGEVIRQEAGLTAVLHHKSSKRLSQAVAQCAVGKKESPGSVKRRVNGLV